MYIFLTVEKQYMELVKGDGNIEASESEMQALIMTQVQINKNVQSKIVNIFLPIIFSICFGCSKESSH